MSYSTRTGHELNVVMAWVIPSVRSVEYEVVKKAIRIGVNFELLFSVLIYAGSLHVESVLGLLQTA